MVDEPVQEMVDTVTIPNHGFIGLVSGGMVVNHGKW